MSKPEPQPITNKVNIDAVNRAIGNAVKSKGYYTSEAVVAVAKTLVNELKKYDYNVPYQMDGMYNNTGYWCKDPEPKNILYRPYAGSCHIPVNLFPSYYK